MAKQFFLWNVYMNDIRKRAHVLNHSHGMCVLVAFGKILHEVSIWTGPRAVLSFILHKSIFIHFVHHSTRFYDKYITSDDKNKYIDDDGSCIFSKKKLESFTMKNTTRHIIIDIMFLKVSI